MSLANRQAALARFLAEPEFEQRVRSAPESLSDELGVEPDYLRWMASLAPLRVAAFRASREVKDRRRAGK